MHTWRKNLLINSRFAKAEGWPCRGMRKCSNSRSFITQRGRKVRVGSAALTVHYCTWTVHFPAENLKALYSWALGNKPWHFKNGSAVAKPNQTKTKLKRKSQPGVGDKDVERRWSLVWLLFNNSVKCSHSYKWRPFVFRDFSVTLLLLCVSKHMGFVCIELRKAQMQMLCI